VLGDWVKEALLEKINNHISFQIDRVQWRNQTTTRIPIEPKIIILPAAYNGAPYIRQQIESIQAQDHDHWHVLIRDDGSINDTPKIIREISSVDDRIEVISNKKGKSGRAVNNFSKIVAESPAAFRGDECVP
jgi:hypothetical protein